MLEIILFTSDFVGKPPSPSVNPRKVGKAALTRVPLLAWSCAASATGTLEGERSTSDNQIYFISLTIRLLHGCIFYRMRKGVG